MKKVLVALLATMLMLCWCGTAMAAEEKPFIPMNSDEASIGGETIDFGNVPKVEKVSDTEYKITSSKFPSFMKDMENASINTDFWYETKDEQSNSFYIPVEDWVEENGVYTYSVKVPEDFVPGSFHISQYLYVFGKDEEIGTYERYGYSVRYDEEENTTSGFLIRSSREEGGLVEIGFEDGEISYFAAGDIYAEYNFGDLDYYNYYLDNGQSVSFDAYGRLSNSWIYDETLGQSINWNSDEGWYYYDNGEYKTLDKAPEGAIDPQTVEAPAALPVPEFTVPKTNGDSEMLAKLPITPDVLPDIASVEEKDGYWVVTLNEDLTKNDYEMDKSHSGFADVTVTYTTPDISWNIQMNFRYTGGYKEGNTYYFPIPEEGATLENSGVEFTIQDGKNSYRIAKDDDGSAYANGSNYGYYDVYAYYDSDGVLYNVDYHDPETYNIVMSWYFDTDTGDLTHYQVPVEENLSVTYQTDGTVLNAVYHDDETGLYTQWNENDGWFVYDWDEDGNFIKQPAEAPEGVKDPTQYAAPYVFKTPYSWYPHNTVGVLGLSLRDMYPGLTDKWYNIAPVDLTKEGTQTIPLAASNMYYFGEATVTVADGAVTVEYKLPGGEVFPEGECLQWFKSVDEITTEFLSNPTGGHAFGEAVSISEELGGQDVALLFICNHVTYRQPRTDDGMYLARFYPGQPYVKSWRAYLTELMTVLEPEEAVEAAE